MQEATHRWNLQKSRPSQPSPETETEPPRRRGAGAGSSRGQGAAAAGSRGGGGGAQAATPRSSPASTDETIAQEKALLRMSFPNQTPLQDDDADLSNTLEMRQQRHPEMDNEDVHRMVFDLVTERVEGMPFPQPDGSLSRMLEPWKSGIDKDTLPLVHLGCPMNRANRLVHEAGGGAISEHVKKKILREFQVTGTIVVFSPEVR